MRRWRRMSTGASRGIGKGLVSVLLRDSRNHVIGVSRGTPAVEHANYTHVSLDLSDVKQMSGADGVDKVFAAVAPSFGRLILINNAGQLQTAYVGAADPLRLASMLTVNMIAPALMSNGFVKHFGKSAGNRMVLNIGSGAAVNNYDGWAGYAASKAALDRFSRVLQMEQDTHRTGIRVFCVHPTIVQTDMQTELLECKEDHYFIRHETAKSRRKSTMSTPEQMARRILNVVSYPERYPDVVINSRDLLAA